MAKELRRQDITFEVKDQALRNDVRTLGTLIGITVPLAVPY